MEKRQEILFEKKHDGGLVSCSTPFSLKTTSMNLTHKKIHEVISIPL
jgi:hypothetical protein